MFWLLFIYYMHKLCVCVCLLCAHFILFLFICLQCVCIKRALLQFFRFVSPYNDRHNVSVRACICMLYACMLKEHITLYNSQHRDICIHIVCDTSVLAWRRQPYDVNTTVCYLAVLNMKCMTSIVTFYTILWILMERRNERSTEIQFDGISIVIQFSVLAASEMFCSWWLLFS